MTTKRINNLVLEALEHERGGVLIYETALQCAVNEDLQEEWRNYLEQTREHVQHLETVCDALKLDPEQQTPARPIVKQLGMSLVQAMRTALASGEGPEAELVACECVVLAETKDHLNWELLSSIAEEGSAPAPLRDACEKVEEQEDEHLYHSKGWCRELWLQALGQKAVLPPPEERKDVKTAIGAARAEQQRESMIGTKPPKKDAQGKEEAT
jgi:hypothetical protein